MAPRTTKPKKTAAEREAETREDSYSGPTGAPSANSRDSGVRLTQFAAEELYVTSGAASRIVDSVAEESTRAGFTIETDEDFDQGEFRSWWEGLNADNVLTMAIIYARLYGGGAVQVISRTEGDESLPLRPTEEIDSLRPVASVELQSADESKFDPKELAMPEVWNVTPIYGGELVPVHNSRLLKIHGRPQPISWRKGSSGGQRYFGMSALQGNVEAIRDFEECQQWATALLKRLQQGVWYADGLAEAMDTQAGRTQVQHRLDFADGTRSAKSTVAIDKATEDYKLLNGSLSGVKDVLTEKKARLSLDTGIPAMILAGDTSGGLNNSADGAMSSWEDTITRFQTMHLTPVVQTLVQIKYPNLKNYKIKWNDLTQETSAQRADRMYKESQADNGYVTGNTLTVDEIRDTLAKRGDYVLGKTPPVPTQVINPAEANPTKPTPTGE